MLCWNTPHLRTVSLSVRSLVIGRPCRCGCYLYAEKIKKPVSWLSSFMFDKFSNRAAHSRADRFRISFWRIRVEVGAEVPARCRKIRTTILYRVK